MRAISRKSTSEIRVSIDSLINSLVWHKICIFNKLQEQLGCQANIHEVNLARLQLLPIYPVHQTEHTWQRRYAIHTYPVHCLFVCLVLPLSLFALPAMLVLEHFVPCWTAARLNRQQSHDQSVGIRRHLPLVIVAEPPESDVLLQVNDVCSNERWSRISAALLTEDHFVKDCPDRIYVCSIIVRLFFQNLRCHVERRTSKRLIDVLGQCFGQAEISNFDLAILEHNVGGLEIPVDEVGLDYGLEAPDDLVEVMECLFLRQPFPLFDILFQISALTILDDQVEFVGGLQHIVEPDNVIVVEILEGCDFLVEVCNLSGVQLHSVNNFDGDWELLFIVAQEDLSELALSEQFAGDLIVANVLTVLYRFHHIIGRWDATTLEIK